MTFTRSFILVFRRHQKAQTGWSSKSHVCILLWPPCPSTGHAHRALQDAGTAPCSLAPWSLLLQRLSLVQPSAMRCKPKRRGREWPEACSSVSPLAESQDPRVPGSQGTGASGFLHAWHHENLQFYWLFTLHLPMSP